MTTSIIEPAVDAVPTEEVAPPVALAPAPVAVAPRAGAAGNYPADDVRRRVAAGITALRAAGWTRPALRDALAEHFDGAYFGGSALWRAEGGRVHAHEVATYDAFFALVAAGKAQPTGPVVGRVRALGSDATHLVALTAERDHLVGALARVETRHAEAYDVLNAVAVDERATKAKLLDAVGRALELLELPAEPDAEPEPAADPVTEPEGTPEEDLQAVLAASLAARGVDVQEELEPANEGADAPPETADGTDPESTDVEGSETA